MVASCGNVEQSPADTADITRIDKAMGLPISPMEKICGPSRGARKRWTVRRRPAADMHVFVFHIDCREITLRSKRCLEMRFGMCTRS